MILIRTHSGCLTGSCCLVVCLPAKQLKKMQTRFNNIFRMLTIGWGTDTNLVIFWTLEGLWPLIFQRSKQPPVLRNLVLSIHPSSNCFSLAGVAGRALEPVPAAFGWEARSLVETPQAPVWAFGGLVPCSRGPQQCSEGVLAPLLPPAHLSNSCVQPGLESRTLRSSGH